MLLSNAAHIAFIVFISLPMTSTLLVPCTTSWSAVFLWLVHSYLTVFYISHSPLFFVSLLALLNQISFFPGQHYRFISQLVSVWIFYDLHWVLGSPQSHITWNTFFLLKKHSSLVKFIYCYQRVWRAWEYDVILIILKQDGIRTKRIWFDFANWSEWKHLKVSELDKTVLHWSIYFNYRDPSWFNESWLARIKEDVGDNVRLKVDLFFFYALVLKSNFENMPNLMC